MNGNTCASSRVCPWVGRVNWVGVPVSAFDTSRTYMCLRIGGHDALALTEIVKLDILLSILDALYCICYRIIWRQVCS